MYRILITLSFLIAFCSNAYGQEIKALSDGWFAIDRKYAELVASRFDSLIAIKQELTLTDNALTTCLQVRKHMEAELRIEMMRADMAETITQNYRRINESYANEIKLKNIEIEQQRTEIKRNKTKNIWRTLFATVGGIGGGILIGALIIK